MEDSSTEKDNILDTNSVVGTEPETDLETVTSQTTPTIDSEKLKKLDQKYAPLEESFTLLNKWTSAILDLNKTIDEAQKLQTCKSYKSSLISDLTTIATKLSSIPDSNPSIKTFSKNIESFKDKIAANEDGYIIDDDKCISTMAKLRMDLISIYDVFQQDRHNEISKKTSIYEKYRPKGGKKRSHRKTKKHPKRKSRKSKRKYHRSK